MPAKPPPEYINGADRRAAINKRMQEIDASLEVLKGNSGKVRKRITKERTKLAYECLTETELEDTGERKVEDPFEVDV